MVMHMDDTVWPTPNSFVCCRSPRDFQTRFERLTCAITNVKYFQQQCTRYYVIRHDIIILHRALF